ncbi:MAG: hypothetical protein IJU70_08705 [Lentisphaeria bacterium]|nr:hypothetical protein [Lentisphaeria bacterium]
MKIRGMARLAENNEFFTLFRRGRFGPFADLNTARHILSAVPGMPEGDLNDFGRGGVTVRRVMLTALLAAWDANGTLSREAGVLGWNGDGCTAENLAFWQDYVSCGREAARGGLFVATLPTIPYCEAAIALKCLGPVAYYRTAPSGTELQTLLDASPRGQYLCGEVTVSGVCMMLADTALDGTPLPDRPTLREIFAAWEEQL